MDARALRLDRHRDRSHDGASRTRSKVRKILPLLRSGFPGSWAPGRPPDPFLPPIGRSNLQAHAYPVEYELEGVVQVPVNVKRGLTFEVALRSLLRQDPDVIMLGEIRDKITADIAIKAALTGHLVFSTLHTNDAASSISRLVDMGIDPFMVASATICVAAQRLVRKLCEKCKEEETKMPPMADLLKIGIREEDEGTLKLWKAVGCANCTAGYKGRFAILEALGVDEDIRRMVIERRSAMDIKSTAIRDKGMLSLRRCGVLNAMRGRTTLEEVLRVTMGD